MMATFIMSHLKYKQNVLQKQKKKQQYRLSFVKSMIVQIIRIVKKNVKVFSCRRRLLTHQRYLSISCYVTSHVDRKSLFLFWYIMDDRSSIIQLFRMIPKNSCATSSSNCDFWSWWKISPVKWKSWWSVPTRLKIGKSCNFHMCRHRIGKQFL